MCIRRIRRIRILQFQTAQTYVRIGGLKYPQYIQNKNFPVLRVLLKCCVILHSKFPHVWYLEGISVLQLLPLVVPKNLLRLDDILMGGSLLTFAHQYLLGNVGDIKQQRLGYCDIWIFGNIWNMEIDPFYLMIDTQQGRG